MTDRGTIEYPDMVLLKRIQGLKGDERAIIETCLDRMETGRQDYGPWKVNDGRDYPTEGYEEIIDALHYAAAAMLKQGR